MRRENIRSELQDNAINAYLALSPDHQGYIERLIEVLNDREPENGGPPILPKRMRKAETTMKVSKCDVGANLKQRREEMGFDTLEKLSDKTKIPEGILYKIEEGKKKTFTSRTLIVLAYVLDVSVDWLCDTKGEYDAN